MGCNSLLKCYFYKEKITTQYAMNSRLKLVLGDCQQELKNLADNSVDLIITAPPYADSRKNSYGGIHPDRYVEWFLPISAQLLRVLKPTRREAILKSAAVLVKTFPTGRDVTGSIQIMSCIWLQNATTKITVQYFRMLCRNGLSGCLLGRTMSFSIRLWVREPL